MGAGAEVPAGKSSLYISDTWNHAVRLVDITDKIRQLPVQAMGDLEETEDRRIKRSCYFREGSR